MTSFAQTEPLCIPEIVLEQVILSTLGSWASDGLSFSAAPSEKIGVVGTSGAGKTTLLRLLNRLISPERGEIFWQGKALSFYAPALLRREIMLVPQEPRLLGMTVDQALAYPLQLQKMPAAQIAQRVQLWKQRLVVPSEWGSRQELELSVGQRQWVSIARALMAQPQVLLLDEPTSALDSGRADQLVHTLKQLDCTVFVASHQLQLIQETCDRILWLDQGTLQKDCSLDDMDWQTFRAAMAENSAVTEWD
jgi:D-methionine transport system ATP-binding protein